MKNVSIMPHTTVKAFKAEGVEIEKDAESITLEPFQTVILASGMLSASGPGESIEGLVPHIEVIGDAGEVHDIYHAIQAGYELASKY